jgi:hypothetical protein
MPVTLRNIPEEQSPRITPQREPAITHSIKRKQMHGKMNRNGKQVFFKVISP